MRGNEQVFDGELTSLRRFENDVASVEAPQECGIATAGFNDWQVGDTFTAYIEVAVERELPETAVDPSNR
jgi:translation initiation factor IF-2